MIGRICSSDANKMPFYREKLPSEADIEIWAVSYEATELAAHFAHTFH